MFQQSLTRQSFKIGKASYHRAYIAHQQLPTKLMVLLCYNGESKAILQPVWRWNKHEAIEESHFGDSFRVLNLPY